MVDLSIANCWFTRGYILLHATFWLQLAARIRVSSRVSKFPHVSTVQMQGADTCGQRPEIDSQGAVTLPAVGAKNATRTSLTYLALG